MNLNLYSKLVRSLNFLGFNLPENKVKFPFLHRIAKRGMKIQYFPLPKYPSDHHIHQAHETIF